MFYELKFELNYRFSCTLECFTRTGSLDGSSYLLFTRGETWNKAREKFKEVGAELVKIETADENEFIKTTFLKTSASSPSGFLFIAYWIGLSDEEKEGEWRWTDGSLLSGKYKNWHEANPDNYGGNENCGSIRFGRRSLEGKVFVWDAEWNDLRCDERLGFICERVSP